ncbi:MAG: hypothetical protein WBG73_05090 [Coleofasciculaceae cyanobacterium]
MNEYLKVFQDITQSSEQLLTDEHNSPEIQQSATSLKNSVQPCIEELKQSATKLKRLVQVGFDDLDHAEDVWNSKPRIAEASKQEIWEQIGEISGSSIRIINLATPFKREAVEQANKVWDKRVEELRKQCFVDSKGKSIKGIGFSDKDVFFKKLDTKLEEQYQSIGKILNTILNLILKETTIIQLELIQHCISLLDKQDKAHYSKQFELVVSENEAKFINLTEHLPDYLIILNTPVKADSEALKNKPGWETYWEDVVNFNKKVSSKMEDYITAIFDDQVELVTEALEEAIAFYNYFLEKQNRYQQETPETRQAEIAWINQQRQQLLQVKNGLEAILSIS